MGKLLTVSVAAYNVERYLDEALKPFADDKFKGLIEVFVIDDGGKDGSLAIAEKYALDFPDIFIPVHKENGGWGSTVNYSICNATGKYFKLLDGDDFFDKKSLDCFIDYLRECDTDCICTPFNSFEDSTGNIIDTENLPSEIEPGKNYLFNDVAHNISLQMHTMTFRTEMLQSNNVSITEHCFYTDVEYVVKSLKSVVSISFCNSNLYQYRIARAGQSVSRAGYIKHYKEHLTVLEGLIKDFPKASHPEAGYKALTDRIQLMVFTQYNIFYFLNPNRNAKKEIREFDTWLKSTDYYENPAFYIKAARKLNFNGFSLLYLARRILNGRESVIKQTLKLN